MISVIVPVYNVEPYLRQCIDSILAQTYRDFELILVDDGSPDNCGAICDEYARRDSRIRVIHQENGGLSAARNAGIDIATGEYISFVDSDDVILDTYLEMLLNVALTQQADISVCGMMTFADGTTPNLVSCQDVSVDAMSGRDACMSIYRMDGRVPVMAWGKLYRTGLFEGIRYPAGRIHEDDATTPQVLYNADRVAITTAQLYLYRQRAGSIMDRSFSAKRFDSVLSFDDCINYLLEKNDIELAKVARNAKDVMQAKMIVCAHQAGKKNEIPPEYNISELKALRIIRRWTSDNTYTWYLSLNHPKLVKPHSYVKKIEEILKLR